MGTAAEASGCRIEVELARDRGDRGVVVGGIIKDEVTKCGRSNIKPLKDR